MTVEENLRAELLEEDGVYQYYAMGGQKVEFSIGLFVCYNKDQIIYMKGRTVHTHHILQLLACAPLPSVPNDTDPLHEDLSEEEREAHVEESRTFAAEVHMHFIKSIFNDITILSMAN